MKLYASEKDIEENELLNTDEYDIIITKYREDFWEEEVYPEIQSLEQHEAEIKEPLLKELETLKTENYHLKQVLEFGKSSYANLQEQLELVNKANKDTQELVFENRQKERQQVIVELLEWAKENNYEAYVSYEIAYVDEPTDEDKYFAIDYDNLKQKLNEMKGE